LATFLFVHGAFHGGWCFDLVRPLLEKEGHTVLTPTLSGVGERAHLAALGSINLDTHIQDVVNMIEWNDLTDIILAGHSYGGMVITGVADQIPERIASLVYLDAMTPNDGDTVFSLLPALLEPFTQFSAAHDGKLVAPFPAAGFGVGEEFQAWVDSKLTLHPICCFTQAIRLTGKHKQVKQRMMVYNSRDIGIPTPYPDDYEALRGKDGCHVYALAAGHDLMVDGAADLATILLKHV